ncbi:hypothetical protein BMETH_3278_0 [methanotrophic bacterial endosymbiont of Bathymodiolus sp.]|nr:hypothetical protein BMETH_3278_0 [methanotrophic bacterial endosymbiont of Bathymodiolus sp.]
MVLDNSILLHFKIYLPELFSQPLKNAHFSTPKRVVSQVL